MAEAQQFVVFVLDRQRFAIPVGLVRQALAAAEATPLPGAPSAVVGMLDVHGEIVALYDVRRRGRPQPPALRASDQLLLVHAGERVLALVAEEVIGVFELDVDALGLQALQPPDGFDAVARLQGGLILIHDVEKFLSEPEGAELDAALRMARESAQEGAA